MRSKGRRCSARPARKRSGPAVDSAERVGAGGGHDAGSGRCHATYADGGGAQRVRRHRPTALPRRHDRGGGGAPGSLVAARPAAGAIARTTSNTGRGQRPPSRIGPRIRPGRGPRSAHTRSGRPSRRPAAPQAARKSWPACRANCSGRHRALRGAGPVAASCTPQAPLPSRMPAAAASLRRPESRGVRPRPAPRQGSRGEAAPCARTRRRPRPAPASTAAPNTAPDGPGPPTARGPRIPITAA